MRIRKVKFQFMWLLMLAVVRLEGVLACARGSSMPVESGVLRGRLEVGRLPSASLTTSARLLKASSVTSAYE